MAWRDLGHVAALLNGFIPLSKRPAIGAPDYQQWEQLYTDRLSLLHVLAKALIDLSDCGAAARALLESGTNGG